jgi:hypothetical protein
VTRGVVVVAVVVAVVAACGGQAPAPSSSIPPRAPTGAERMLALLPDGAELVVELDLARLRANPVVGPLAIRALGVDAIQLPGGLGAGGSDDNPLAAADAVVLAAWGVGTPGAATVTILATHAAVHGATRLTDDLVALGPAEWVAPLEARAGILATGRVLWPSAALLARRAHAMPAGATGAILRITATLPADAQRALARELGVAATPAALSLWADVADDLAIVVDAEVDAAARGRGDGGVRLQASLVRAVARLADLPLVGALGAGPSLDELRVAHRGPAIRAVLAIGPARLRRIVARGVALLAVAVGGEAPTPQPVVVPSSPPP